MTITDESCTSTVSLNAKPVKHRGNEWDKARIYRLGFLVGIGWDARRIGCDPLIRRSADSVRKQIILLGGCLRDAAMGVSLRQKTASFFDEEAAKRGLTREKMIQALLEEIAADKTLFDNVMDDGDRF